MVVPVGEEEAVEEAQLDAVAADEVPAERGEGHYLARLGPRAHRCLHPVVDVDLQVEVVRVAAPRLRDLVEEVVQQEEVVEQVLHRQRGRRIGSRG